MKRHVAPGSSTSSSAPSASPESPVDERRRLRRVMTATVIGTTVEWYDFYLYATMASIVFGRVFFTSDNSESNTLKAFATFAV